MINMRPKKFNVTRRVNSRDYLFCNYSLWNDELISMDIRVNPLLFI